MIESIDGAGGGAGGGTVDTIVAGTGISVNSTDPANPIVSSTVTPGVTGFTGSQNTASPNNTVNASRLLVDAGTTNADAVIQPKGTGAFQLQLADGTSTGGNKRGTRAIDLQLSRTDATQVASGANSVVIGSNCIASGSESLAMHRNSHATGAESTAIGSNAQATGTSSVALGSACIASGQRSLAIGTFSSANQYGMLAHCVSTFQTTGDAQYERYMQRRVTTNSTATELSNDGNAPAASTRIAIASDSTYAFEALVVARRTDADNESAGYKITGVIDNNAGTTALVGTPTVTILAEDTAAWDIAVTADNTNDALVFTVTGENAKTIRWVATVHLTKVSG